MPLHSLRSLLSLAASRWGRPMLLLIVSLTLGGCQAPATPTASPTVTPAPTATPAPTETPAAPPGVFWVDPGQDLGVISPFVMGANHGPWADFSPDNLEPAKQSGVTFLRWPGGRWGDVSDIQPYQIDWFIKEAKMMQAEPSVSVRLPGGSPQAAAALVRYANVDMGYGIKYWSIGNEPSLYESDTEMQGLGGLDAVSTAQQFHAIALAMKAVDPTIKLYGPDIHQFMGDPALNPKDKAGRDYLEKFLKVNADVVDVVTVHRYPFLGQATPETLMADTPKWDTLLPDLRRIVKTVTGKDLPVGVTEYNSDPSSIVSGEATPDSFLSGLWLVDIQGRLIRHQPELLAFFQLKSSSGGLGMMTSFDLRPSYYAYQLYKRFGNHLLAAQSPDELASVFAAKKDDGTVTLILVNRSTAAITKPLQLAQGGALKLAEAYLFAKDHPTADAITLPAFKNGDAVTLPAYSALELIFRP